MAARGLSEELVPLLAEATALEQLDSETILHLATEMEEVRLGRGEVLIRQGEEGDRLFVLLRGRLTATLERAGEEDQILREIEPGDLVGEVALLAGGERTATVRADQSSILASLTRASLDRLLERNPDTGAALTSMIAERLRRSQLATHLSRLFGSLELAALRDIERSVDWVRLSSGEILFYQGDHADAAYVVVSGRVRVTVTGPRGVEEPIGEVGRGETVGEIALLTHGVRSATVFAIRDTDLARFSQEAFDRLTHKYPGSMAHLTRIIGTRLSNITLRGQGRTRKVETIAIIPVSAEIPIERFCDRFLTALKEHTKAVLITRDVVDQALGRSGIAGTAENDPTTLRIAQWLTEQEAIHEMVVYQAESHWSPWTERAVSHADQILLLADPASPPERSAIELELSGRWSDSRSPRQTLVLLHDPTTLEPTGTARWLDLREVDNHVHLRNDRDADYERLARLLTGHAFTIVFGGGGARGFAHIGAIRALEEVGIPIDMVGGTSMGGIIAANVALGLGSEGTLQGCKKYFRSLFDYTLPLVSMLAGRRITDQLRAAFGHRDIEDFWLPYFCVSTNLTRAEQVIHRRGNAALAMRASISLPGVMPPVWHRGDLLVDGGILNNLPSDVMRSLSQGGRLIAVDVTPAVDLTVPEPFEPQTSGWKVLWERIRPWGRSSPLPSLLSILTRVTLLSSVASRNRLMSEQFADLYLQLPVQRWGMLDFDAIDDIAREGYEMAIVPVRTWSDSLRGEMREETPDPRRSQTVETS